jgi:hypothetical protein
MLSIQIIDLIPPKYEYTSVTIPMINTEGTIPQPDNILKIIAVAKNLIPSARRRVTRNIIEESF